MERRCIGITVFCTLAITAAVVVMSLYHTSLRFDKQQRKTSTKPNLNNQAINTNTSECTTHQNFLNPHSNQNILISVCPVNLNLLGDGYCDDQANTEKCLFDMNDCCDYTNYELSRSECTDCFCHADIQSQLTQMHSRCLGIIVQDQWAGHGDGQCDSWLNNVDDFFDAGDCCYDSTSQDQCIQSNAVCNPNTLGDGICQDYNYGPYCDYDLGDCCLIKKNVSECCLCMCTHQDRPMIVNNTIIVVIG